MNADPRETPAYVRPAFYASRFISQAGQGMFFAALFLVSGTGGASALELSGVFVAMMAASVLLSMPAGALSDWLGPGRAYVFGATLRFCAIGFGLILFGRAEYAWAVAFAYSAASQLFSPSELALVSVVQSRRPGRAHATLVALQYVGQAAGVLVLAPVFYVLGGAATVIVAAMTLYAVVVLMGLVLAIHLRATEVEYRAPTRRAFDLTQSLRFLASEPRAAYAASLLTFSEMAMKALAVALPLYIQDDLHFGAVQVAAVIAFGVVGVLIGFAWAGRSRTLNASHHAMRLVLIGTAISLTALSVLGSWLIALLEFVRLDPFDVFDRVDTLSYALAFPLAVVLGLCFTIAPIGARTVLTKTAPKGQQARVFATQATITDLLIVLPIVASGIGAELVGARVMLIGVGVVGFATFLLLERVVHCRVATHAPA